MTLDEAIKHCEEVAKDEECIAHSLTKDGWQEHFDNLTREKETEYKNVRDKMANSCLECAEEHRQLAEWLKELKQLREQEPCDDCISREAVKEQMIKYGFRAPDMTVTEFIEDLPPVTPQPKTKAESEDKE